MDSTAKEIVIFLLLAATVISFSPAATIATQYQESGTPNLVNLVIICYLISRVLLFLARPVFQAINQRETNNDPA